jgi:RIO kinase 1
MRLPSALVGLLDDGIIDEVVRPLQSGKEAQIFLVMVGDDLRVAKVYKETNNRSFKHRADYTEGRRVRSSRDQRAMQKRSKFGRAAMEEAWSQCEVDMLRRLQGAGVRVPEIYDFVDGVLIMELIKDEKGQPAPRLADLSFSAPDAKALLENLVQEVVKMLCAGVVHGDLSDFNILMDANGPVIIDLPQAIDTAHNSNAKRLLIRDVNNLRLFLSRFSRRLRKLKYGQEMWALYDKGTLEPDTVLTGKFQESTKKADSEALLREIQAAAREAAAKREEIGVSKYAARKAKRAQEIAAALEEERNNPQQDPPPDEQKKKPKGDKNSNKNRRPRRRRRRR